MMTVAVNREWDSLAEAVVGNPFTRLGSAIPIAAANYMPAASLQMAQQVLAQHAGKTLQEAMPELHEMAVAQMAAAVEILRSRGIVVHEIATLTPAEAGYLSDIGYGNAQQYFPRDPVLVVGDQIIETAMRYPLRRMERFGIRRTLEPLVGTDSIVAMPEPAPLPEADDGSWGPGPFLEGGDVLLLGPDVLVGVSGNASTTAGARWLQRAVGSHRRVQVVPLSTRFLHLDCVLATPREGLALVCQEGFPEGLPDILSDWEIIEVPAQAAEEMLAVNVLVLDEDTVLVASETPAVAEALDRAGQTVLSTPFAAVSLWGGSFRCWHHPLRREGPALTL